MKTDLNMKYYRLERVMEDIFWIFRLEEILVLRLSSLFSIDETLQKYSFSDKLLII